MKRFFRNLAIYLFHITFVRPVLYLGGGVRFRRRSLLPKGPCLVVANHNSHLDAAILATAFPLRRMPHVHPVAAADYFGKDWLRRTMAMLMMNAIPIERRPARGVDPLAGAVRCLQEGETLIFFPEGSRGKAGVVAPFRSGVGRLIRQNPGLLVVPVFLAGPERIWPRGQFVPVPFTLDAIIGRPRTYDVDDEPKVIAEQVRNDVLALAPPAPPLPGPRPAPPIRIAICGLDALTRKRVYRAIVARLGPIGSTLGLGEPALEADAHGERETQAPIPHTPGRAWVRLLGLLFRLLSRRRGSKFVTMLERAQINEAVGLRPAAELVVTDGSALVDLMAWAEADFYAGVFDEAETNRVMQYLEGRRRIPLREWWKFLRKAPDVWLVNVLDLARPTAPDLLLFVSSRQTAGADHGDASQAAWRDRLSRAYMLVGNLLHKRRRVEFLQLDADEVDTETIAETVAGACARLRQTAESATTEDC